MQYIASNITPSDCYPSVSPNAPTPKDGGDVSEMLSDNLTLLDNLLQQSGHCVFDHLASRAALIGSSTTSSKDGVAIQRI